MRKRQHAGLAVAVALLAVSAPAQDKKEFNAVINRGATVSISNEFGAVKVHSSSSKTLLITAVPHSAKVEVDFQNSNNNRIEARSHILQNVNPDEAQVDYDVSLPTGTNIVVRSSNGPLAIEDVNGDVTCEGESASVQVRNGGNGHVHVRTVEGPVKVADLKNAHIEIASVSGDISLNGVTGPSVVVNTTKGKINYTGDFDGGGDYSLSTHSGDIDVAMPTGASVDMSAKSVQGSVEDAFSLKPEAHPMFVVTQGKSFAGVANSGASSVKLRSFSGKIRVKKQ
jgi:ribosomal protein S28E/S33